MDASVLRGWGFGDAERLGGGNRELRGRRCWGQLPESTPPGLAFYRGPRGRSSGAALRIPLEVGEPESLRFLSTI